MKDLRWKLYWKATWLRDKLPWPLYEPIDWLRYEVLQDPKDKRYWYD